MTTYRGSTKVQGGYYWNRRNWAITAIGGDEGVLEGTLVDRYVRLPLALMVPLAAVMSFGFVIFLPLLGFLLFAYAVTRKVGSLFTGAAKDLAVTVTPSWEPGAAYFAGKPGEKDASTPEGKTGLEPLKEEIAQRRAEEKKA